MRQCKGKRIDNDEWVKGWYVESKSNKRAYIVTSATGYDENPTEIKHLQAHGKIYMHEYYRVIPKTVGQSTGLKDKNGKEYYFGDIAEWGRRKGIKFWVVVWSRTLAGIELQPLANYKERQGDPKIKRLYGASFGIGQAHASKKVGNIHDNLELLEKENEKT